LLKTVNGKEAEDLFGLENQEEYERIIKSGWVTFENGKTVVWKDSGRIRKDNQKWMGHF